MIVAGKLITCKREVKTFNNKEGKNLLYITIAEADISEKKWAEIKEAFKDSGKSFTPEWVKNFTGYVNLKTEFALPCKDPNGEKHESIEEFVKTFPWLSAPVKVSINLKDGAIYPNAVVFEGEGKDFNPFAEFDNDEED